MEFRFSENTVDAQSLETSKDIVEIREGMCTFTLCDDEEEDNNGIEKKIPDSKSGNFDNESIDFTIEEIKTKVDLTSACNDMNAQIVEGAGKEVNMIDEDFGTFQDFTGWFFKFLLVRVF